MGRTKSPIFRCTEWMSSMAIARAWLNHFKEKGIPAGIVTRNHHPNLSVWRCGEEAGEHDPSVVTDEMEIEGSVNNFDRAFNLEKRRINARERRALA